MPLARSGDVVQGQQGTRRPWNCPAKSQTFDRGDPSTVELQSAPLAVAGRLPAARKHVVRPRPERTAEHAHLGLEALRDYRKALTDEEGRVSYWRRILQARLDVVRAGTSVDSTHLRPVLADSRVTAGRSALMNVLPVDDIPPLPDLAGLWDREVDSSDEQGRADLEIDLFAAEQQLSEYRSALHRRLGAATAELIARYREQPALCLVALPLPPSRRAVSA